MVKLCLKKSDQDKGGKAGGKVGSDMVVGPYEHRSGVKFGLCYFKGIFYTGQPPADRPKTLFFCGLSLFLHQKCQIYFPRNYYLTLTAE